MNSGDPGLSLHAGNCKAKCLHLNPIRGAGSLARANESTMSSCTLLLLTLFLLLIPGSLLPAVGPVRRTDPKPEIHGLLRLLAWINGLYCILWHRLSSNGWAPLPQVGPAILISNHTCGIDHLLLQATSQRVLGFMVAREYYEWPWIHWICKFIGCIPVNRNGRDLAAIRTALRALKEGRVLPIFPEGHIVPSSGRRLDEIKPGSAYIAIQARVPVVPAYIVGTPPTDQIFKALVTPSRARVLFGEPIDLSDIDPDQAGDKALQAQVSQRFKEALLALQARALAAQEGTDQKTARMPER
jgi:1-acyl-sn-glycerol-3-phosphate acyltransferase